VIRPATLVTHGAALGAQPSHDRRHHLRNGHGLAARQGVIAGALDGVGGDELC
jgi:hypothetical protein